MNIFLPHGPDQYVAKKCPSMCSRVLKVKSLLLHQNLMMTSNFYQTSNLNVAKMFHMEADVKRPALVLLKNEAEKVTHFDGQFHMSAIAEFVSANKLPLVTIFSRETASLIFESQIEKQLLLFSSSKDWKKVIPIFEEAAKLFKGKVLGYTVDDARKYVLDEEYTFENIKAFGQSFFEDKLKPFFKSDPIPENNDGDVKVVVGNNFDDIVLDESKDVLLQIYAPWCGHFQALEPTFNKLKGKSDGFPTILFFPAAKKNLDPLSVEMERTVVSLYKFLKKHASIPFGLQKPVSSPASGDSTAKEDIKSSTSNVKDEL